MSLSLYVHSSYKNKQGLSSVYVQVILDRKIVKLKTGIMVNPDEWNKEKQQLKGSTKSTKDINMILENCRNKANEIIVRFRLMNRVLSPEVLKKEYEVYNDTDNFHDWAWIKFQERKSIYSDGSVLRHDNQLKKIRNFNPKLRFSDINRLTAEKFIAYCRGLKNKQSTIKMSCNVFKVYLRLAVDEKKIEKNPFTEVKVSSGESRITYVTEEELKMLFEKYKNDYHITGPYKKCLTMFLFSCFTGLRYSDIVDLEYSDIINNHIIKTMVKTERVSARTINIPLVPQALLIIENMKENDPYGMGKVFDSITNQALNRYLKSIFKLIGIKRHVTMHSGRHTFGTIYFKKTKDLIALKNLLGHSKVEQTMVYAHVMQEDTDADLMAAFDF